MISKLLSVHTIINHVMEDTGIEDAKFVPIWTRWAIKADREVGAFHYYKPKCKLVQVHGCYLDIPCDAVCLLPGMVLTNATHINDITEQTLTYIQNYFSTDGCTSLYRSYSPGNAIVIMMETSASLGKAHNMAYIRVNDQVKFQSNAYDGKFFLVRYLGYDEDCDGFPLIRETNADAANYFIQMKMGERGRFGVNPLYKISSYDLREITRRYGFYVGKGRSDAGEMDETEYNQVREMMNNPFTGIQYGDWCYHDRNYQNFFHK